MARTTDSTALLTPDSETLPFPRLAVEAARLSGVRHPDRDTSPLILGQNAPNPHLGETRIPFTLLHPADVRLEIFDLQGRKMAAVVRKGLSSGEHCIQLNLRGLCLPGGDYPYLLHATTIHGTHSQTRTMTLSFTLLVPD